MLPVCPKCDSALFALRLNRVEMDYCERCHGVWLDAGELEELAGAVDPLLTAMQDQPGVPASPKIYCPRCDAALDLIVVPSLAVEVDRCPRGHGLWFDADELRQVLARCAPVSAAIRLLHDLFAYKKPQPQGG